MTEAQVSAQCASLVVSGRHNETRLDWSYNSRPIAAICNAYVEFFGPGHTGLTTSGYRTYEQVCAPGFIVLAALASEPLPPANCGSPECPAGNPIDIATGNKYQEEVDYSSPSGLQWSRSYNSAAQNGWKHFSDSSLLPYLDDPIREANGALSPKSSGFTSQATACTAGWGQVKAAIDEELGVSTGAQWDESTGTCGIYVGPRRVGTTGVYLSNQDFSATPASAKTSSRVVATPRGATAVFRKDAGGLWTQVDGRSGSLTKSNTSWEYVDRNSRLTFNTSGGLISSGLVGQPQVTVSYQGGRPAALSDPYGRALLISYDALGRVEKVTDPAGGEYLYTYTPAGHVEKVTYPDGKQRQYHYEGSVPTALTGITDENGDRFATWAYDISGRAYSSEHAGGADRTVLDFGAQSVTVTQQDRASKVYTFVATGVSKRPSTISQAGATWTYTYDANGFLDLATDANGNVTDYNHNGRGLETQRIEAKNTAQQRVISTQWHATLPLPLQIDEPGRTTSYTYDEDGYRLSKTVTDVASNKSRTTTWTYQVLGDGTAKKVKTVDGPQAGPVDLITYDYELSTGNLTAVTNALGHQTTFDDYDAHGNARRITDPNGVVTIVTYDLRQRVKTRSVAGATTSFEYDGVGQLEKVILGDGSQLIYSYDPAHRLTGIQDHLGNTIVYTLDAHGNRTKIETFDPAGSLRRSQGQVFDALGHLKQIKDAAGAVILEHDYDLQGNRIAQTSFSAAGVGHTTTYDVDALNRVWRTSDPEGGIASYNFNALDQLVSVVDARNLETLYSISALGDLDNQASPDTGASAFTYDTAGNRLTKTDARGIVATYAYDALNRLTGIDYPGVAEDVTFAYDSLAVSFGVGRLTSVTDQSGTWVFEYDARGNRIEERHDVGGTTYTTTFAYDSQDRLTGITYPTGRAIAYERDAVGQISRVLTTKDGVSSVVANNIAYLPFGPATSFTLGNGIAVSKTFDRDYRLSEYQDGGLQHVKLHYDQRGNVEALENLGDPVRSQSFGYDEKSRLQYADGHYGSIVYSYDAGDNRRSQTIAGTTVIYGYPGNSHRLSTIDSESLSYDSAGNMTARTGVAIAYNAANRAESIASAAASVSNRYDAWNRRASKAVGSSETVFHYDLEGRLIAETNPSSPLQREYIWLGDVPLQISSIEARPEALLDNVDEGFSTTGAWVTATSPAGFHGANFKQRTAQLPAGSEIVDDLDITKISTTGPWVAFPCDPASGGLESGCNGNTYFQLTPVEGTPISGQFNWKPTLPYVGTYRLYFKAPANPSYTASVPMHITTKSGEVIRRINQRIGSGWQLIGTYEFDPATAKVMLGTKNADPGSVVADAVRFVPVLSPSGSPADQAHWVAPESGQYQVLAKWPKGGYSRNALFRVKAGSTASLHSMNQSQTGGQWISLGTFNFGSGPDEGITLFADADATVAADAMRFVPIGSTAFVSSSGFFHVDHLNTPQKVSDSTGGVLWDAIYRPFGQASEVVRKIGQPLRFPGQYFDAETGLHQNWHRDYDPSTGRYTQSDPIGLLGGLSTYSYVGANPSRYIDPRGLWSTEAHDYLLGQLAESQGLNQAALQNLQLGSRFADSYIAGHQADKFSYLHSMTSSEWPDKTEACKARFNYIKEMLADYDKLRDMGGNDAYWYLGRALHPLMDSTSPAHAGWQYWDNSQIPRHGPSNFSGFNRPDTEEGLEDLLARPDLVNQTMRLMKSAMSGGIPQCGCE